MEGAGGVHLVVCFRPEEAAVLAELWHAFIGVMLLTLLVSAIYIFLTDLPLAPFLLGEAIGAPTGMILLALSSPRRHRR